MSKLASQAIELFRVGDYGDKGVFTPADLDQMVANFNSGHHDVPHVIGHPETDHPAYGWLASLQRVGDVLTGTSKQVEPQFEAMVEAGRFKKRSVALAKGAAGWVVKHVGWLGAKAPEVKGLADCKFEQGTGVVEITFEEDSMAGTAEETFIDRLNAWWDKRFPGHTQSQGASFSEADVKRIAAEAAAAAVAPVQAKLDAQAQTFSERDKQLATAETAGRAAAAVTKLKAAGKWVPAFDKAGLPIVFAELAKQTTVVEFGEGATKQSLTPLDALVSFMQQLPAIVPNAQVYTGTTAAPAAKAAGINDTQRTPADPNSLALHQFVETRMKEQKIDYGTALARVTKERPEFAIPGGSTAGAV